MIDILTDNGHYRLSGMREEKNQWRVYTPKKRFITSQLPSELIMDVVS